MRRMMLALLALSDAIEARDPYTCGHSARVARMAHEVGIRLGCNEIELSLLQLGGALHDVGKLVISQEILRKPGPLTDEEFEEVRVHPLVGCADGRSGQGAPARLRRRSLPSRALGRRGLPDRVLRRPDSARGADPLGLSTATDAMTSDRPYRSALPPKAAAAEVDRCAGAQFDPDVAVAFLAAWESGALGVTAALRAAAAG